MLATKADWHYLRSAVGIFAICVLLGSVALGASHFFRNAMQSEFQNHQLRFRDVSRKYLAVDDEEQIIQAEYPEFLRLHRAGILGAEHRLNWIETLRAANQKIHLPKMSYRINSQTVYEPEFVVRRGAFDIYVSEMKLNVGLLHEGDLVQLLGALNEAEGIYSVRRCVIERRQGDSVVGIEKPNVNAQCLLDWYTVDLKGERRLSL